MTSKMTFSTGGGGSDGDGVGDGGDGGGDGGSGCPSSIIGEDGAGSGELELPGTSSAGSGVSGTVLLSGSLALSAMAAIIAAMAAPMMPTMNHVFKLGELRQQSYYAICSGNRRIFSGYGQQSR
jgi:hypothetical protein